MKQKTIEILRMAGEVNPQRLKQRNIFFSLQTIEYLSSSILRIKILKQLRQVLFDLRAGNSNVAKSLSEKSNHAMYQDENPHRCLLSLQN